MADQEQSTTETKSTEPIKFRLFANSEQAFRVVKPSVFFFENIRKLALRSTKISLDRKFDICKELALDWKTVLNIENRKELDEILKNIATSDPSFLGDKVLEARNIKERFNDASLTPFQLAVEAVPYLFEDDNNNAPSVSKDSEDDLLIGNIEKAMGVFFNQINISEEEQLAERSSFKVFTNSEDEFPLSDVSVGSMRKLNELQVQTASMSEKERRAICEEMRWSYEKVTPNKITDMKSKSEYWIEASQIILKGVELTDSTKIHINAGEINRALTVFFAKSDGLL